ncbi:hypothetical protein AWB79_01760 [Caballeronia hypogeia]|uniref:Glycosyltransferase family 25 (LPS biosynthesis protein) n=1 Tax=Caballeronia hypogeia TaxID=1777140 RepID=A0A158A0B9_9BURK|nr:hypothetical protein [Caballeronia hypogeia]SAK51241.1 hypothetical protein AWB79_01760 [Caballeronia hypogeia]
MELDGYFVNLSTSDDRRKSMEARIDAIGYRDCIKRFPAVDGRAHGPFDNPARNAIWACRRSHEELILRASADSATIVLEDDVEISAHFPSIVNPHVIGLFVAGNPDADLLFLDCCPYHHQVPFLLAQAEEKMSRRRESGRQGAERHELAGINLSDAKDSYAYCAAAYVVTPKGKQTLRTLFPLHRHVENAIDALYKGWIRSGALKAKVAVPFLATPKLKNTSTIPYDALGVDVLEPRDHQLTNTLRRLLFAGEADIDWADLTELLGGNGRSVEYMIGMQLYEASRSWWAAKQPARGDA